MRTRVTVVCLCVCVTVTNLYEDTVGTDEHGDTIGSGEHGDTVGTGEHGDTIGIGEWLKIHHPENVSSSYNESTPATSTCMTPLARSTSYMPSPSTSSHLTSSTPVSFTSKVHTTPAVTKPKISHTTTPKTPGNSLSTPAKQSPLTDLLNLPVNVGRSKKGKMPSTGVARVLTRNECLQKLKEKEEKKRQVQLEKEKRKMEGELKKQQREEEERLKAEARAKRTVERKEARAKKEAAKADKKATIAREQSKKCLAGKKRSSLTEPRPLSKNVLRSMEAKEDTDHCCVCFGSYQEHIDKGREWIQINCTRWLHEDCIDQEDVDASGKLSPLS